MREQKTKHSKELNYVETCNKTEMTLSLMLLVYHEFHFLTLGEMLCKGYLGKIKAKLLKIGEIPKMWLLCALS